MSSALLGQLPPGLLLPSGRVEELSHPSLPEPSGPGGPWGAEARLSVQLLPLAEWL